MNRPLLCSLVFTLGLGGGASAQTLRPPAPPKDSSPPAWLPRGALLATSLREGAVTPEVRLQWQLPFFHRGQDMLGLLLEPTASFAAVRPTSLTLDEKASLRSLQFYSLMVGVGYTKRAETGLEWGFQINTGPAWYQARFTGGGRAQESYFVGMLDGRARIGYRFAPIGLGVTVGYGDPYNYRRTSLARPYIGGLQFGLYADWR